MFWQLWRAVLWLRKSMVSRCKRSFYCARFTLHGLLYTVYSEQFTLHVLLCKIYSAQFTPHDLLCSIYSAVWSDQWRVWHCLLETCLEVVWWLWSPHLPSPTFTSLLLNHAPLQTSLRASYTPHTNFLPARDPFPVVRATTHQLYCFAIGVGFGANATTQSGSAVDRTATEIRRTLSP